MRALRKARAWKQRELAERLGSTRSAVSRYEQGRSTPPLDALLGLAAAFECSLDDLVLREPPGARPASDEAALVHLARATLRLPRREREALIVLLEALLRPLAGEVERQWQEGEEGARAAHV